MLHFELVKCSISTYFLALVWADSANANSSPVENSSVFFMERVVENEDAKLVLLYISFVILFDQHSKLGSDNTMWQANDKIIHRKWALKATVFWCFQR